MVRVAADLAPGVERPALVSPDEAGGAAGGGEEAGVVSLSQPGQNRFAEDSPSAQRRCRFLPRTRLSMADGKIVNTTRGAVVISYWFAGLLKGRLRRGEGGGRSCVSVDWSPCRGLGVARAGESD